MHVYGARIARPDGRRKDAKSPSIDPDCAAARPLAILPRWLPDRYFVAHEPIFGHSHVIDCLVDR